MSDQGSSNLRVKDNCIMCGGCLGLGFDFLTENDEGAVVVKRGTYLDKAGAEYKALADACPVGAIVIDESVRKKSQSDQLNEIIKALKEWEGLAKPSSSDIKFDIEEYEIPIPCARGTGRYDYSSERAAERAAENEFDNIMYSKINTIILQVISKYRVKKLKRYYSSSKEDRSVYYEANQPIIELLESALKLLGDKLPNGFTEFDIYPWWDSYYKMLNKGEIIADEFVSEIRSEFDSGSYSSLSSYRMYFDTDDMEVSVGKGLFGDYKYKTKYCYRKVNTACKELAGDLKSAIFYKDTDIMDRADEILSWLVDEYNKKAKEVIQQKISQIEFAMKG